MRLESAIPATLGAGLLVLLALGAFGGIRQGAYADHDPGGSVIDILAYDAVSTGNDATNVETVDDCVSLAGVGSTTTIDVVVDEIPAFGLAGFGFDVIYNPAVIKVNAANLDLLLGAAPPYNPFSLGNPVPDTDGDFRIDITDLTANYEFGEGVLVRLAVEVVGPGSTTLTFDDTIGFDGTPDIVASDSSIYPLNNVLTATVRVGQPCSASTDLAATAATVSASPSAPATAPFSVTAGGTVVNNGPSGPVNADVRVSLNLPTDCSYGGTQVVEDVSLAVGSPVTISDETFSVTCAQPSFHAIAGVVQVVIDDPISSESTLANNVASSANATTAVLASSDLKLTSIAVTLTQTAAEPTTGISLYVDADVTVHNNGPVGPIRAFGYGSLTVPADCRVHTPNPQVIEVMPPVSVATIQQIGWMISCEEYGAHTFTVDASVAAVDIHVSDAAGNNAASGSTSATIKVGACGDDPNPVGGVTSNPSPTLLALISQLTGGGTPVPNDMQTPLACSFSVTAHDPADTPIDDCGVQLGTEAPCGLSFNLDIDLPTGSPQGEGTIRLNPVGVTFVPASYDWAGDLEVPNGTPSANAVFGIRTDAGLIINGTPCLIDVKFNTTVGVEGGIQGNVPDSNVTEDLTNPNVWPNDLNAERALVESKFTPAPLLPPGITLWSRTIVPLEESGLEIPLNVLTWKVTNPAFQLITGAQWIVVPFPGDAVNPDLPGTIGGDPDSDDPPPPFAPFSYCTPHKVNLNFSGMAGSTVFLSCIAPGTPISWNLVDPDALNWTGDDGPRSDNSTCALDLDNDGLSSNAETYWGTNPNSADTDGDGLNDVADNCKTISNAGQADYDSDGTGDACDTDVDGDGALNTVDVCPNTTVLTPADLAGCSDAQVDMDADGWCDVGAPSTGPSNCSPTDNCPTIPNADQSNVDGDIFGDACDGCIVYPNYWTIPPNDSDCDGFSDAEELFMGTLGGSPCSLTIDARDEEPDAWPPDFDDNKRIQIVDVSTYSVPFAHVEGEPEYSVRHDTNGDDRITILDVAKAFSQTFGRTCP